MSPASASALSLSGLTKAFGGLRALDDVSLEIQPGERRAIIGPNGAGKTTLFSLVSGEQAPTGGRIALFGRDITRLAPHRRAALGLARTYQITNLFPRLTVLDNCLLAVQALSPVKLHLHRPLGRYRALFDRAEALLESVGLLAKRAAPVRDLSHGEQRQLEIALALAGTPRLLLLDEPTAGLALAESQMMVALLKGLDPAITILIIEHDMAVAFELTDRVTVLHYGRVVADGSARDVRADPLVQEIYLGAMGTA
ncbi:MAG: ABC transporter ATP-binding protein [Candidatus Rokubacteria bacterium RBG_16_73_20]|nr:MAG: ABC transporter ATP-binding protein [Candidatus Rokubacteria bacterium GWA2_73_35]OGK89453.1 MAG: ABC transporter ATP-binding protein [Candidatus Rokubacteria bacterium RBG_16_73_20]HAM55871.1 ABC transporter ATP-binding protein [Candidatus Rokubacteria bacterium]